MLLNRKKNIILDYQLDSQRNSSHNILHWIYSNIFYISHKLLFLHYTSLDYKQVWSIYSKWFIIIPAKMPNIQN